MPFGGRAGYWDDSYEAWVGGNPTKVDQINKVTELLEVVTKQLARFAPRAGISMLEDTYFLDEDNMVLGDGLCELEHMSIPAEKTSLEIEYVTLVDESYFFEKKEEEEYDMVDDEYFELVAKKKIRKHRYGG